MLSCGGICSSWQGRVNTGCDVAGRFDAQLDSDVNCPISCAVKERSSSKCDSGHDAREMLRREGTNSPTYKSTSTSALDDKANGSTHSAMWQSMWSSTSVGGRSSSTQCASPRKGSGSSSGSLNSFQKTWTRGTSIGSVDTRDTIDLTNGDVIESLQETRSFVHREGYVPERGQRRGWCLSSPCSRGVQKVAASICIPSRLKQACQAANFKLNQRKALTSIDLYWMNEALFNVPEGEMIDGHAAALLYLLLEQIRSEFRRHAFDNRDGNFRYDYIGLLGNMQNQPFFSKSQQLHINLWIQEALKSTRRPKNVGPLPFAVNSSPSPTRGNIIAKEGCSLVNTCQTLNRIHQYCAEDLRQLNEAVFSAPKWGFSLTLAKDQLLIIADKMRGAFKDRSYVDDGTFWHEYLAFLATMQNLHILVTEQRKEFHIRIREAFDMSKAGNVSI